MAQLQIDGFGNSECKNLFMKLLNWIKNNYSLTNIVELDKVSTKHSILKMLCLVEACLVFSQGLHFLLRYI